MKDFEIPTPAAMAEEVIRSLEGKQGLRFTAYFEAHPSSFTGRGGRSNYYRFTAMPRAGFIFPFVADFYLLRWLEGLSRERSAPCVVRVTAEVFFPKDL